MNSQENKYVPIDCGFVDIIEHYATLRQNVLIAYVKDDTLLKVEAVIKTWENTGEAEYMVLKNGLRIRLDHIKSIGDKISSGYCGLGEEE